MIDNKKIAELSFEDIMKIKEESRNSLVKAVYSATNEQLEKASISIKEALRPKSENKIRPKKFSQLKK
jgi:hypothetical protein